MRPEAEIERDWRKWRTAHSLPREIRIGEDKDKFGNIVEEVFISEDAGSMGDYVKLIQLIVDDDGSDPWLRFTYYRKATPRSRWIFAGQWSLMASVGETERLLDLARKAGFFARR